MDGMLIGAARRRTSVDVFGPDYFRRVTSVQSRTRDEREGLRMCFSGGVTGNHCGILADLDTERTEEGVKLVEQRLICDFEGEWGERGDSGAPVYEQVGARDARAAGIASRIGGGCGFAGLGRGLYYTHISIAAERLNFSVCVAGRARCGR